MTDMATTMTAFGSAIKDLVKFKIIQNVNTGDKSLDSLLNTFLLALMAVVYAMFNYQSFVIKYYLWKNKKNVSTTLNIQTMEHYKKYMETNKTEFVSVTWTISGTDGGLLARRITEYFTTQCSVLMADYNPVIIDPKTMELTGKTFKSYSGVDLIKKCVNFGDKLPIFVDESGVVGITKDRDENILLLYNNKATWDHFVDVIKKMPNYLADEVALLQKEMAEMAKRTLKITKLTGDIGIIYEDRTFDMFVSKHKPMILNRIENFKKANSGISMYGGYSSYNLGFLLHGAPGTGKTMFFKALCNALKRDAYIIDMREIRTGSDFAKIFRDGNSEKYKKYVYILDEFDCVQGVIKNRSLDGTVDNTDNQLAELRDRMIKIMGLLAKMSSNKSKDSKDANEPNSLEEELRSIRKQIQELQNKLTLDTMLTILDGTDEHRGRVIVAATNYVANIDKALIRNGRFDEVIELGAFDENEMREMLHKMYDKTETTEELQKINTTRLKANTFTPTDLIKLASRYNTLSNVLTVIADDTKSLVSEVDEEKVEIEVQEEKVVEEKVVEDTTTSITVIQQNSADSFRQDNLHGSESKQHKKTKKNRKR